MCIYYPAYFINIQRVRNILPEIQMHASDKVKDCCTKKDIIAYGADTVINISR